MKLLGTHCIQETPKRVLLQTVKTQMKCSKMLHFIGVYTVWKGKKDLQTKEYNFFSYTLTPLDMYNEISQVYCIRRKNPLVFKGLRNENMIHLYGPAHKIIVLINHTCANASNKGPMACWCILHVLSRCVMLDQGLHLHPYFVYACSCCDKYLTMAYPECWKS